jgi:hypothetical protein
VRYSFEREVSVIIILGVGEVIGFDTSTGAGGSGDVGSSGGVGEDMDGADCGCVFAVLRLKENFDLDIVTARNSSNFCPKFLSCL